MKLLSLKLKISLTIRSHRVPPFPLLAMFPLKNKPSTRPTTLEDIREASAPTQSSSDRINSLLQRAQEREEQAGPRSFSSSTVSQTSTTTTESSSDSLPEPSTEFQEVTSIFSTTANEERVSTAPQDLQVGEATQAAYTEVSRAIEESQAISFWDPLIGFFFGSTLAGLVTIGVAVGGTLFFFRGRLNRESVSRALSFFRNNRLLTSAIFGGGTTATTLITQNGAVNWAELQRRIEAFIRWVSVQNVSPSSGLRVPSIFKARKDNSNTKKDGKEEEPDNVKDPFSDAQ